MKATKITIQTLEALLIASSSFKCGNVQYTTKNEQLHIFDNKQSRNFYSTCLVTMFDSIATAYLQLNIETMQIELIVSTK